MVSVNSEEKKKKKSGFHGSVGITVCEKKKLLLKEIYFFVSKMFDVMATMKVISS